MMIYFIQFVEGHLLGCSFNAMNCATSHRKREVVKWLAMKT